MTTTRTTGWAQTTFEILASTRLGIAVMAVLGVVCAAATVYESLHGTPAAQRAVYQTAWFTALLSLFGVCAACSMLKRWPFQWVQAGFVMAHVGIVLILAGSLLSLHIGLDARLVLTEGQSSAVLEKMDEGVHVVAPSGAWVSVPVPETGARTASLADTGITVTVDSREADGRSVRVRLTGPDGEHGGTLGWSQEAAVATSRGDLRVTYAPSAAAMPFTVTLADFVADTYPGSRRAATYESHVRIEDPERGSSEHVISMNRPLHYRGYVFFQSSYVEGTPMTSILSVSRAPGLGLVYAGTTLVGLGIFWMFYVKPALARRRAARALQAHEARHAHAALAPAAAAVSAPRGA